MGENKNRFNSFSSIVINNIGPEDKRETHSISQLKRKRERKKVPRISQEDENITDDGKIS